MLMPVLPFYAFSQPQLPENDKNIRFNGASLSCTELLSRYLQIPSVSGHEKEAGEFLKSVCEQNGLVIHQMGDEEGNYNFAASLYPLESKKPNILFLNHIDVVPAGESAQWKYPPFEGRVVEDEIWGRGALDMKGVAVAQLEGLLMFKNELANREFDFNVTFLAVSSEEVISSKGASFVLDNYMELLNPAVVFCEGPTGLTGLNNANPAMELFGVSVADKRPLMIKLQISMDTFAHGASSPDHYAAKDMTLAVSRLLSSKRDFILNDPNIQMIKGMGELEKGIVGFVMRHPRIFKPLISLYVRKDQQMMLFFSNSITLVDYRTVSHSPNSLPQSLECRLDCRLMPGQDSGEFIESIKELLGNPDVDVLIVDSLPLASDSPTNNLFFQKYGQAILNNFPSSAVIPAILPGYSDCTKFRAKGVNSYGSNPFLLDRELLTTFHNFNERIPVSALKSGAKVYHDFLLLLIKDAGFFIF
jgi:acetylornithine deacetylase/succinyl-diaminopimelate desuccinylase-like protein